MGKAIRASLLVLFLCPVAHAGYIPNDSPTPPPPQPATAAQEPTDGVTLNGNMHTGLSESLTQTALDLLAVLPSLL